MQPIVVSAEQIRVLVYEFVYDAILVRSLRGETDGVAPCRIKAEYKGLEALADITVTLLEDR